MIVECPKCGVTDRFDSSEIDDTGALWHPIWTVKCRRCGSVTKVDAGTIELFDDAEFSRTKNGVKITVAPGLTGHDRVQNGDIRERWAQKYFKERYKKLGFSKIKGPFRSGPDFWGIFRGRKVTVEIERTCESFRKHRHHLDPRFSGPCVLVVLSPSKPSKQLRKKLPKTIVQIDIDDFVEWWKPKARRDAEGQKWIGAVGLIASEFQNRFRRICSEKDREMVTCPECDLCPYFGNGECWEARRIFEKMAVGFIAAYRYRVTTDDFKLSSIQTSEIDEFFEERVSEYLWSLYG